MSLDLMYDEAVALKEGGDIEAAVAKLHVILEQDANYALAHSALSVFYGQLLQYDEAVTHAQRVCELEPNDPFSFVAMSLICQKAGRLQEAEEAGMQARRLQFAS